MKTKLSMRRALLITCIALVLLKVALISARVWSVVEQVRAIQTLGNLQGLSEHYGSLVTAFRNLDGEVSFLYPILQRLPGDIQLIPDLAAITREVVATTPELPELGLYAQRYAADPTPQNWTGLLTFARSISWQDIHTALANTQPSRRHMLSLSGLSDRAARLVRTGDDILTLAEGVTAQLPRVLDVLSDGQVHRVLVIAQNNDELRATGGFLTAVNILTITPDGRLTSEFLNSYAVDDLNRLAQYPAPPAGMLFGMNLTKWLFRDMNWSPDFPTTARQLARSFSMGRGQELDAVIAVNLNVVRQIVDAIGPIQVNGIDGSLDGDGVIAQMRRAWNLTPETFANADAKDFLRPFLEALATAAKTSGVSAKLSLLSAMRQALTRRDLMLYARDAALQKFMASEGWDGALRETSADYLMVVDSNIGFNKVNPRIQEQLDYHVNLAAPGQPFAQVLIRYTNTSPQLPCTEHVSSGTGTYEQRMTACYWDNVRLYVPRGARLLAHNLEDIPAKWSPVRHLLPGVVSVYAEDNHTVLEGYALVPTGQDKTVHMIYRLPDRVLETTATSTTYRLIIQKQPGSPAYPVHVSLDLPPGAEILSTVPTAAGQRGQTITFFIETMDQDAEFTISYRPPPSPRP
jgi:Protein of unknown function (DUF4012)